MKANNKLTQLYNVLITKSNNNLHQQDIIQIEKAFNFASKSSKDKKRLSGESYICHPLRVAIIVQELIGLGTSSVIAALIHDCVKDDFTTLDIIGEEFGDEVAGIVAGMMKISSLYTERLSLNSENFITLLLTISNDVRIILLKLADRLDNIRMIKNFNTDKQLKIAKETRLLYAPIAHRLGLYHIKTELEDISLRYIEPNAYFNITNKLKNTKKEREKYIEKFTEPICSILDNKNYKYEIKGRPKSVNSIYNKITKKGIDIDEIFDLFAIRIIIKNTPIDREKEECWNVYSLVTNIYQPNPLRLRDWISTPRPSGYESLHTTVMGPDNHWVEVQIRTEKMDEIAEKGDAAHWKYKESTTKSEHDSWLTDIRNALESKDSTNIDKFQNKQALASNIFIFTPQGDIKKLRENATVLDFAYAIHSNIGNTCTGAKVNDKIQPIKYKLQNGDTVEVITSKNQFPKKEWVNIVASPRTKIRIKKAINEKLFAQAKIGKEMLGRKVSQLKIEINDKLMINLISHFKYKNTLVFYQDIADNKVDLQLIKEFITNINDDNNTNQPIEINTIDYTLNNKPTKSSKDYLVIDKDLKDIDYKLAKCCHPISGDDIFGFVTIDRGIIIHRKDCPNAKDLTTRYSYRIVPAKWTDKSKFSSFLVKLTVTGIDKIGIVNNISEIISKDNNADIRSMTVNTKNGIFQCFITIQIKNLNNLDSLLNNINNIKGVLKAER